MLGELRLFSFIEVFVVKFCEFFSTKVGLLFQPDLNVGRSCSGNSFLVSALGPEGIVEFISGLLADLLGGGRRGNVRGFGWNLFFVCFFRRFFRGRGGNL